MTSGLCPVTFTGLSLTPKDCSSPLLRGPSTVTAAQALLNWVTDFMSLHYETAEVELSKESERVR